MQADDYQQWTATSAIYPGASTGNTEELVYLALGLNGEAGEVADKIKKYPRDNKMDVGGVIYELGDVAWYLARLADAFGYSLSDILEINHQKIERRKTEKTLQGEGDYR